MPKRASSETTSAADGPRISRFQKFTVERWRRTEIKNAPYNPRTIDSYAKKKLAANLKKIGLLETLVVNRRTGNLVSGHQRLACLDVLEGTSDYMLDVSVVELTEKQEREQNIFMNNPGAQGAWDVQALGEVLKDLEIEATGFDKMDLEVLFDETQYAAFFAPEKAPEPVKKAVAELSGIVEQRAAEKAAVKSAVAAAPEAEPPAASASSGEPATVEEPPEEPTKAEPPAVAPSASDDAARIAAMKERRRQFKDAYNAELDTEFYLVVVCGSREESDRLVAALGPMMVSDRYVDGRLLGHKLGIDWSQPWRP